MRKGTLKKLLSWIGAAFLSIILLLVILFYFLTGITPPVPADLTADSLVVSTPEPGIKTIGNSWLKQNDHGLWEIYISGKPYERGVINGKLSEELIRFQEKAFVDEIAKRIPSGFYRHFLKYFIYWFNRELENYVPEEYKLEILGISRSADPKFSFIGDNYRRILNYHSAHDIGHAIQDFRLVGCSSFGAWKELSSDSSLIIGRNFDFYMGDEFAENKIVCFEKPDSGFGFMMVTWGGMIGTLSGMNEKGLTVTINAAKSEIPFSARTPISLLAREILQYAGTIGEAFTIAQNRQTFVSESILIGSGDENKAAIIEKSPYAISLYQPSRNYLVCTNHFQSQRFQDDPLNQKNKRESASLYRYQRMIQDLSSAFPIDPLSAAKILRDQRGLNGEDIGMGNEKAVNQLIAHHSIIFKPRERKVWISTSPWQLGPYLCYDLTNIFNNFASLKVKREITESDLEIPSDPFLYGDKYIDFLRFRMKKRSILKALSSGLKIVQEASFFKTFIASNPEYFEVYSLTGDYYMQNGNYPLARENYRRSLGKEIPVKADKLEIIGKLAECNKN